MDRNEKCQLCSLHSRASTVCVPGRGATKDVRLIIVGEAPGPQEDRRGEVFVGNAGSLLETLLESSGVNPAQIRFENIVRCFPQKDDGGIRPPTQSEVEACIPYLFNVLDRYASQSPNPPIIVALGNTALKALTGRGAITRNRGVEFSLVVPEPMKARWGHLQSYTVIGTIHPAAVLRGRDTDKPKIVDDLRLAWAKSGGSSVAPNYSQHYKWIESPEEWEAWVDGALEAVRSGKAPFVAWDFETTGLDPFDPQAKIVALAACYEPGMAVVCPFFHRDCPWADDPYTLARIEESARRLLWSFGGATWNGKFDVKWAYTKLRGTRDLPMFPPIAFDGMLAHHWFWGDTKVHDLDTVAANELGFLGHGREMKSTLAGMDKAYRHMGNSEKSILLQYAGGDADATFQLSVAYTESLRLAELYDSYYALMVKGIDVMAELEVNGIMVDPLVTAHLDEDYPKRMRPLEDRIRLSKWGVATSKALQERPRPLLFSLGSPETLSELLFNQMGLKSHKISEKTKRPSADREVLDQLIEDISDVDEAKSGILEALRAWRTLRKYHTTYIKRMAEYTRSDGLFHTTYNLSGTATGRHSSSSPSLHTIPKGSDVRLQFISRWRKRGGLILSSDMSQAEVRVAASLSGDPTLIEIVNSGVDMHSANASKIFGIPVEEVTKKQRQVAKTVTFACVPMDTETLTPRGWVTYDDLSLGDMVLAYNQETGFMEWSPVLEKVFYPNAPVTRLSNGKWASESTPNHRWFGMRSIRGHRGPRSYEPHVFQTQDIRTEARIRLSAPATVPSTLDMTTDECELLGWVVGDGNYSRSDLTGRTSQSFGAKRHTLIQIIQSKDRGVSRLRELAAAFGLREYSKPPGGFLFRFPPEYARDFARRSSLFDGDLEKTVLSMGTDQRDAFLRGFVGAEGWTDRRGVKLFSQNQGDVLNAGILAAFMSGFYPTVGETTPNHLTRTPNFHVRLCRPWVTGQRLVREDLPEQPVWCVRTPLESWVIRQHGRIMITGNTLYGASADRVSRTADISVPEAEKVIADFFKAFPKIHDWMQTTFDAAVRDGFVSTPFGRLRYIKDVGNAKWGGREWRQACNTPIQCHAFGTKVLTLDLRWVPIESLVVGDRLVGFDETKSTADGIPIDKGGRRYWRESVVTETSFDLEECFEVALSNGDKVTVTGNHPHLTANMVGVTAWRRTNELQYGGARDSRLVKVVNTAPHDLSGWEVGYIAGMFDADGCLSVLPGGNSTWGGNSIRISLAQMGNESLAEVQRILTKANFRYASYTPSDRPDFFVTAILGDNSPGSARSEVMRFLSTFRPPRLLAKFEKSFPVWGQLYSHDNASVVSVTSVGVRRIVRLGTSTRTYVADGYATHNSVASDITFLALQQTVRAFRKLRMQSKVFGFIHDSIIVDVAPGELALACDLLRKYMVDWTNEEYPWLTAKMVSEFELCPGWGYPMDMHVDGDTYTAVGSPQAAYCLQRELTALGVTCVDSEEKDGKETVTWLHRWQRLDAPF